jgi:hypothetical protein
MRTDKELVDNLKSYIEAAQAECNHVIAGLVAREIVTGVKGRYASGDQLSYWRGRLSSFEHMSSLFDMED